MIILSGTEHNFRLLMIYLSVKSYRNMTRQVHEEIIDFFNYVYMYIYIHIYTLKFTASVNISLSDLPLTIEMMDELNNSI